MSEDDPNNRDPIARKKLAALYGEGNIVVLPRSQFLRYQGGEDIISILSSELKDPVGDFNDGKSGNFPSPGKTIVPPPANIQVVGVTKRDQNGMVTVKVKVEGIKSYNGSAVSYVGAVLPAIQKPTSKIAKITVVATYPIINLTFDTVPDANKYLIKLIKKINPSEVSSKVHYPAVNAGRTSYSITGVPKNIIFWVSVTPYNEDGISGQEVYAMDGNNKKEILFT